MTRDSIWSGVAGIARRAGVRASLGNVVRSLRASGRAWSLYFVKASHIDMLRLFSGIHNALPEIPGECFAGGMFGIF